MQNDKLEKLKAKRREIDAQIRQEQNREIVQQRKLDTRRKILAGAAVLSEAGGNQGYKAALWQLLDSFLGKPDDRVLFDLPPLPQGKTAPAESSSAERELEDAS